MARALLSSIDIISLDDTVVSLKSALYMRSICTDKGSCPPLRKLTLATRWLVPLSGPMRVQPSNVRAAQGCLRRPRRSSKTQCASGTSLPIKMDTSLSSLGKEIPWRWGQSRISSVHGILLFETGRLFTVHTRSRCMYSFDVKAFTVRLTSSPSRWVPSALMVVRANDVGEPSTPNSSTRRCKHRVVSEPSSRNA